MASVVVPMVEVPVEETLEAGTPEQLEDSWEVATAAAAPGASPVMEMPAEDPWEVATAAAVIASTSEGSHDAGRSEEPGRDDSWAMVQPGIPPVFDRNELWEYEAWAEHYKVNDEIYNALTLSLDLHRERSLQVSDVSNYPAACSFLVAFLWFFLTSSRFQQLKQMSRDKSDELAH